MSKYEKTVMTAIKELEEKKLVEEMDVEDVESTPRNPSKNSDGMFSKVAGKVMTTFGMN